MLPKLPEYFRYLPNFLTIVFYLSYIINLSTNFDAFSLKCTIARKKSLFRRGFNTTAKNNRPISLLLLILKIIEDSLQDQTQDYLQTNELLQIYQSGFSANNSIDICLYRLVDMILNSDENLKHTDMISVELQKALDILDHKVLLSKMKCIGFSDKAMKWLHSYLTKRAFLLHWIICFQKQSRA